MYSPVSRPSTAEKVSIGRLAAWAPLPIATTEVRSRPGSACGPRHGALVVEVRIRLGTRIARFAPAPVLTVQLPNGATIDDLLGRLSSSNPELAPALRSAVAVVGGMHVDRGQTLTHGDDVALLAPVAGG
jgi:molybdopterin converting factor small subunit